MPRWLALALALVTGSCGGGPRVPPPPSVPVASVLSGTVSYERRRPTLAGLSRAVDVQPARRILVQAVDEAGVIQAATATDDQGRYELRLERPAAVRIRATTVIEADGLDLRVLRGPLLRTPYEVLSALQPAAPGTRVAELRATVGGEEPAGAFHILDRFLDGARAVQAGVGVNLPPLIGLWRRGNTQSEAPTSFFSGASRTTPGAFELQLMGGEAARPDASDSDQFDSGIILHELGHFVNRVLGTDASIGGQHDRVRAMVPGVAFDEGFPTLFACAVLRDPVYLDTAGLEPGLVLRHENMEDAWPTNARGVGTETTTFELLWDMADGTPELPDRDGDGVAVGLGGVLRVIQSFERSRDDVPYIGLFLQRAIALGVLSEEQVVRLVKVPRPQGLSWPLAGGDVWPTDLPLPASVTGKIDGVTDPQEAGGRPDPVNGYDAIRVYRIRLPQRVRLVATLSIAGSGLARDRQDIDLALYDVNTDPVSSATAERPVEDLVANVGPGTFLLYVKDGGSGNRASYRLDVRVQ